MYKLFIILIFIILNSCHSNKTETTSKSNLISPADKYDKSFNNKRKSYTMQALTQLGFMHE